MKILFHVSLPNGPWESEVEEVIEFDEEDDTEEYIQFEFEQWVESQIEAYWQKAEE